MFSFLGEKENGLVKVRVELEGDQEIDGWLDEKVLKRIKTPEPIEKKEKPKEEKKFLKRGAVPSDEAALLRREPSFQYGVYVGPNFNILSHQWGEGIYSGVGFTGGGFVGFYLDKEIILRGEVGYQLLNGSGADGVLSFGLLDVGLTGEYLINRFSILGSIRYDFGIGIGDIPRTVQLGTAQELNSLWFDFGGGMRFPLNEVTSLVLRVKYGFAFNRIPVVFQSVGALGYLEIRG